MGCSAKDARTHTDSQAASDLITKSLVCVSVWLKVLRAISESIVLKKNMGRA